MSSVEGTATGTEQAAETAEEQAEQAEQAEPDERREGLLARLHERLGDDLVDSHIVPGDDVWVRVRTEAWDRAARVCTDLGFTYFSFLSAVDWMPSPFGRSERGLERDEGDQGDEGAEEAAGPADGASAEVRHGYCGGETRLQVVARVYSIEEKLGITLKADVPDDTETVPTWSGVYSGADWHEREAWEMFGITFAGHPHLAHIYLPGEFEGYPLRKDFPLLAREVKPWPGIVDVEPMPGDDAEGGAATETDGGDES